jgi:hypothetical protein
VSLLLLFTHRHAPSPTSGGGGGFIPWSPSSAGQRRLYGPHTGPKVNVRAIARKLRKQKEKFKTLKRVEKESPVTLTRTKETRTIALEQVEAIQREILAALEEARATETLFIEELRAQALAEKARAEELEARERAEMARKLQEETLQLVREYLEYIRQLQQQEDELIIILALVD